MLAGIVGLAVDLTQCAAAVKPHIPGYESRGGAVCSAKPTEVFLLHLLMLLKPMPQ